MTVPITVLCVDGFLFKGFLADIDFVKNYGAHGATVTTVPYDNVTSTTPAVIAGAATAKALALAAPGPVVFVGVSEGSQLLCNLLRSLRADQNTGTRALGSWSFYLFANPEHVVTGRIKAPQYGGLGIPNDTPYPVTDCACQYDYWADDPNVGGLAGIYANAYVNMWGNAVHSGSYFGLDPALPFSFVTRGNIRDMWAPMASPPWGQSLVEMGYKRPVKPAHL